MSNQAALHFNKLNVKEEQRLRRLLNVSPPEGGSKRKHSFEVIATLKHPVLLSDLISIIQRVLEVLRTCVSQARNLKKKKKKISSLKKKKQKYKSVLYLSKVRTEANCSTSCLGKLGKHFMNIQPACRAL